MSKEISGFISTPIAQQVKDHAFDSLDAMRIAVHAAVSHDENADLDMHKFVFDDGSFLCARDGELVAVDPQRGESLMRYARWVGVASVSECKVVGGLLSLLACTSQLIN